MGRAQTVRTGKLGKKELSLVEQDGTFYGMSDRVVCVEGGDKEDVWRRLQNDAGKSDPRYFGFDYAKNRFLKFFRIYNPNKATR